MQSAGRGAVTPDRDERPRVTFHQRPVSISRTRNLAADFLRRVQPTVKMKERVGGKKRVNVINHSEERLVA